MTETVPLSSETRHLASLLYQAQQAKKGNTINDCWTSDGKILVKDKSNKIIPVHNLNVVVVLHMRQKRVKGRCALVGLLG